MSRRVAREMTPLTGGRPIEILQNGVELDFWRQGPERNSRPKERLELISVMRLNPKKRPFALLDLMEHLVNAGHDSVRLRLVGDGPLRNRLQRAVIHRDLAGVVELTGRKTREEIRGLYRASDLFVLPTIRESFGLAAIEARTAGLPVVAMRASGVSELLTDDRDGWLAASDEHLFAVVASICENRTMLDRVRSSSADGINEVSWPTAIDQHIRLYHEAIGRGRPPKY